MVFTPTGVTITPERDQGVDGNPNWQPLQPIRNAVFAPNHPVSILDRGGLQNTEDGSVYVPRGCDLRDGDRVEFNGTKYGIVGAALWDMNHPFTGDDLGYVEFVIRKRG